MEVEGRVFPRKKTGCTSAAEFPVLAMAAAWNFFVVAQSNKLRSQMEMQPRLNYLSH